MSTKNVVPGLCWSLFHPVAPDVDYMKKVVELADSYGVEGFEMCGDAHGPCGGLEGVLLFEDYPAALAQRNQVLALETRGNFNRIVALAHHSGRKFIYWHREVMVPTGVVESAPEILDEKGEIDFNSEAYWEFIRYKIRAFFKAVPGMDGIVLTLTEADYSVIHNSDPKRYPPIEVAARVIRTFSEELEALGKSLTFRTFGSIDEDYRVLSAAADLALKECTFEIETKVTPFDWSLFLPDNPYLKRRENASLAAEFDLIGEYFGLGELPCLYPDLLLSEIRYARECGATRFPGRIDRYHGKAIESVNEMNLYTFTEALKNPKITSEEIWQAWAAQNWGEAGTELIPVMKTSVNFIKKSFYMDSHLFCQNYRHRFEMMMLGGTFALFKPGISLKFTAEYFWSMFSEKTSPTREAIVSEKEEAVAIAGKSLETVKALADRIPAPQREKTITAWQKATHTSRMQLALAHVIIAYFEDMESKTEQPVRLEQAIKECLAISDKAKKAFSIGMVAEIAAVMHENADLFRKHYAAEFAAREDWNMEENVVDCLVCGGLLDEWRVKRFMHGSGFELLNNRPVRLVGNRIFPNGFLEYTLQTMAERSNELLIRLHGSGGPLKVTVNEADFVMAPSEPDGFCTIAIPVTPDHGGQLHVRLEKAGTMPPRMGGLAVRAL